MFMTVEEYKENKINLKVFKNNLKHFKIKNRHL